ncbi:hypothetical protein NDU88_009084 [Pleurodeles waltl]|uniref:Uncharacterized protein n=1 Tax=Pleurodeles waltl TaxID=8319 RepID=A0AAV7RXJ3_PLEWA|nr:hypothetical protein NDU88_009084 [Pleurodeles waltl]
MGGRGLSVAYCPLPSSYARGWRESQPRLWSDSMQFPYWDRIRKHLLSVTMVERTVHQLRHEWAEEVAREADLLDLWGWS